MVFGPIMRLKVVSRDGSSNELPIELAPLSRDALDAYVKDGMAQSYLVMRFRSTRNGQTLTDRIEWYERARRDESSIFWGVWVGWGSKRQLIGTTAIVDIGHGPTGYKQAESGVSIFNRAFWNKGIATAIHKARTWFAFTELGLTRITSYVFQGNYASKKALEKSGYMVTHVERNTLFTNGVLHHRDNLECLNPLDPFWRAWWGSDRPTQKAIEARKVTQAALEWAAQNVILP